MTLGYFLLSLSAHMLGVFCAYVLGAMHATKAQEKKEKK